MAINLFQVLAIFSNEMLEQSINYLFSFFEKQLTQTEYLLRGKIWSISDISALDSCGYYNLRFNENCKLYYLHSTTWFDKFIKKN